MSSLRKLKERALRDAAVRMEYEALEEEFNLVSKLLEMRLASGLSQEEVATRMHTKKSNVCRLEKGNTNPSWKTISKYAHACGYKVSMEFQAS